jgi:hypothetical protein
MENAFLEAFKGNATQAAADAKYRNPNKAGNVLMKRSHVRKAVEAKMKIMQEEGARAEARVKGHQQGITRVEITELLANIARHGDSDSAKTRALLGLADIKGMRINRYADVSKEFEGRTEEELEYLAVHGHWPEEREEGKPLEPAGPSGHGNQGQSQNDGQPVEVRPNLAQPKQGKGRGRRT